MIAFEHGALRGRGEPLLAGILAYGEFDSDFTPPYGTVAVNLHRFAMKIWPVME
jgi:hypothetical protein